jgi:hypothetical protein
MIADSGKVKRVCNNTRVNIGPRKMDGTQLGEWVPASAREVKDENIYRTVDRLLDKKYGFLKKLFTLLRGGTVKDIQY